MTRSSEKPSDLVVLRSIKQLLSSRKRWCKDYSALAADGAVVSAHDPDACRWCLTGATELMAARHDRSFGWIASLLERGRDQRHMNASRGLTDINDGYGFKAVRHTINTAIRRLETT